MATDDHMRKIGIIVLLFSVSALAIKIQGPGQHWATLAQLTDTNSTNSTNTTSDTLQQDASAGGYSLIDNCIDNFQYAMSFYPDTDLTVAYEHIALNSCLPLTQIYQNQFKYTDCAYHSFDILDMFSNNPDASINVTAEAQSFCNGLQPYLESQHSLAIYLSDLDPSDEETYLTDCQNFINQTNFTSEIANQDNACQSIRVHHQEQLIQTDEAETLKTIYQVDIDDMIPILQANIERNCYEDVLWRNRTTYCQNLEEQIDLYLWTTKTTIETCDSVEYTAEVTTCEEFLDSFFGAYKDYRITRIEQMVSKMTAQSRDALNQVFK